MRSWLNRVDDWGERAQAARYDAKKLAVGLRVSVRQLERFVRSTAGSTPQQWLNTLRLARAFSLLNGTKNVKEVATELGYKQASHFSRAFKSANGFPPSRLREAAPGPGRSQIRKVVRR